MTIKEVEVLIKDLTARVEALEAPRTRVLEVPVQSSQSDVELALGGPSEEVSHIYRAAVDYVLNKDFGIHLKYGGGNFTFSILVPEKYSPLSPDQKKILKVDVRPKVLDNAEGENGVRLWADRVMSSFNPAIQAQIVSDRIANP